MATIFWFLVVITIVVFFHELGHFLFAKLFKTKVEEFAIGMGPKLFSIKGKETEFKFNLIPLGGYVKIAGEEMEDTDKISDDPSLFYNKKPWQKFLIAFAGPAFSILLGYIILAFSGMIYGFNEVKIAEVIPDSPAFYSGLEAGDVIHKVNGNLVFDSSILSFTIKEGKPVKLEVLRNNTPVEITVKPEKTIPEYVIAFKPDTNNIELTNKKILEFNTHSANEIKDILPNLEKNDRLILKLDDGNTIEGKIVTYSIIPERYAIGVYFASFSNEINKDIEPFRAGDRITSINGIEIKNGINLIDALSKITLEPGTELIRIKNGKIVENYTGKENKDLNITVLRNNQKTNIKISKDAFIQILQEPMVLKFDFDKWRPKGFEVITTSIQWANTLLKAMVDMIGQLFTGKVKTSEVMGPVGIAGVVGQAAKAGPEALISLIALITLNLGIVNLLPIPALDGGRIVFSIYEMITGKRTNPKVEATIHTIGFILLMILFIFITFNDISRFFK
ncbi:site-2 protease family protein [Marinitoga sp. 1135]|uniref:site-2 protease family protein n=1 Tax=Marinitoga sp. 1135 TaxID=1643333 RepID=UPI001585F30F|nr:site-2 protease family protein [Marinitoga sp. 1135]